MRLSTMTGVSGDPARIAAQIVSGIGFLGAGAIIRNQGELQGLTTASTIWLVAALGMGVGAGEYLFSVFAAVLILLSLLVFPSVERFMGTMHQAQTYHLEFVYRPEKMQELIVLFENSGLHFMTMRLLRRNEAVTCAWKARGAAKAHQRVIDTLLADPEIISFENH
jgi:putative Mg2+ transporter-C (MgtC) family protein